MAGSDAAEIEVDGRTVRLTNPGRVYFSARGETKLDLAHYYLSVADGIVRALRDRPCMMHRFPSGVDGEKVHQKRLPKGAPDWVPTVRVHFPRYNRTADELCVASPADVIWAVQMSTVEFHPWNTRAADVETPDEWRIDLDPMPGVEFPTVRRVAAVVHEVLDELGAVGFPKTSGGKGLHVYVRVRPEHSFTEVRRAAHSSSSSMAKTASSMPACRSPSSANRAGTVAMVKSRGSASSISSQRTGVDTTASGTPRTEYAAAIVWSRAFWL